MKHCGKQVDEGARTVEAGCIIPLHEEISKKQNKTKKKNHTYGGDKNQLYHEWGEVKKLSVDDTNESES